MWDFGEVREREHSSSLCLENQIHSRVGGGVSWDQILKDHEVNI